jgi:RimJ/RimL family protein N-acetyltransferase
MLELEINFNDINVSNVEKKDLTQIQAWMEVEKQFVYGENSLEELYERYLESYISECEFFLKINKKNELIGILKGRLEFKNPNEVWIWFFYLNNEYRTIDVGVKIIQELINYFFDEYGIDIYFTRIIKADGENVGFWKNIGFKIVRMVKDFYCIDGKYMDMLIMKKVIN